MDKLGGMVGMVKKGHYRHICSRGSGSIVLFLSVCAGVWSDPRNLVFCVSFDFCLL